MITNTLRTPALGVALTAAVLTALLALVSIARATPPPITDSFSHGDNGWEIYEGASEHKAQFVAKGGHPGGFIRYHDADTAPRANAVFADEHYVAHISRYIGRAKIVFDLRTNKFVQKQPQVTITDPGNSDFPAIHTVLDQPPTRDWRHYAVPIDAGKARWFDRNGKRVRADRFKRILDRDPVFVVRADYSRSAGERTDFDSVGIVSKLPRTLSLTFNSKKGKLSGRLKVTPPSQDVTPSCANSYRIKLLKVVAGPNKDHLIGRPKTNSLGRFKLIRKNLPKGRYYAFAPSRAFDEDAFVPGCERAISPTIKRN